MATYQYQGVTSGGRLMRGELEAPSAELARETLAKMGVEVQSAEEVPSRLPRVRIGRAELMLFNQQLASIAQAEGGSAAKKPTTDAMGKVELKRQYMQARQAWIAGGKKGDPPPMPDGLD